MLHASEEVVFREKCVFWYSREYVTFLFFFSKNLVKKQAKIVAKIFTQGRRILLIFSIQTNVKNLWALNSFHVSNLNFYKNNDNPNRIYQWNECTNFGQNVSSCAQISKSLFFSHWKHDWMFENLFKPLISNIDMNVPIFAKIANSLAQFWKSMIFITQKTRL